ncbi:MAG: hypothetical protein ACI4IR_03730 [Eubacterium sp.]
MKKIISIFLCIVAICMSLSACSSTNNEMTEENITKTVDRAFDALAKFDTDDLNKYVDSPTLTTIISYAEKHQQFADLGRAIFENLSYEIKSIDTENQTVTISVQNKDLYLVASDFARELKSDYTTFQLLAKLSDDSFLDRKLNELCDGIANAKLSGSTTDITLSVEKGKKNLVLVFDNEAENSVSGGALSAIKTIYGLS